MKTLQDIANELKLAVSTRGDLLSSRTVTGGYAGDMLSDVLAHARKGQVWVTLQTHANIVAVASSKELCGIIVVHGRTPEAATLQKAEQEHIPILVTLLSSYDVVARLCELGVTNREGV